MSNPTMPQRSEQTVLLAVFDILGFSNRVRDSSLAQVRDTYDRLRERTVERYEIWSFDLLPFDGTHQRWVPASLRLHVNSVVFSDSVFAWVPLKQGFANPFVRWCCEFMCEGLAMDLPIRGAITAGDAILDQESSTYLGKPILEAHELEANQNWMGLAFTHQATWPPLLADISPKLLMEYQIPVKRGATSRICPDWPRVWRDRHGECPSSKLLSLADMQPEKFKPYYSHAAAFAKHSKKNANWFDGEQPKDAILRMRPFDEVRSEARAAETRRRLS